MQITINQAEIELAISNYVRSQVNVAEGVSISIDLAATRGAAGFTAVINLVSDIEQLPVVQDAVEEVKPKRIASTGTKPLNLAAKVAEAKAEEPVVAEPEEEVPAEGTAEDVTEEQVDEVPRQSLFAGMGKPRN